jgi:hypothetical protein
MLDRGNCTFFDKALNAFQAGASGLIIIGHPPTTGTAAGGADSESTPSLQMGDEGLIRPSAEGEDPKMAQLLRDAEFGVVYIEWAAGQVIMAAMDLRSDAAGTGAKDGDVADPEGADGAEMGAKAGRGSEATPGVVGVEVTLLDGMPGMRDTAPSGRSGVRGGMAHTGGEVREGRVMVADHLVHNLRIIEHP